MFVKRIFQFGGRCSRTTKPKFVSLIALHTAVTLLKTANRDSLP